MLAVVTPAFTSAASGSCCLRHADPALAVWEVVVFLLNGFHLHSTVYSLQLQDHADLAVYPLARLIGGPRS